MLKRESLGYWLIGLAAFSAGSLVTMLIVELSPYWQACRDAMS